MAIAYFDCFSGISGDMIVGALIDLGVTEQYLHSEIQKVPMSGYCLEIEREPRGTISGTRFKVVIKSTEDSPNTYNEIREIISKSELEEDVKEKTLAIFHRLAWAEASIHRQALGDVHFHEVGAIDAVVDIVCSVVGLKFLKVDTIYGSRIPLGSGFTSCAHGTIPIPAPATLMLLENVPVYDSGQRREMVTPTGAAILTTLAQEIGKMPNMKPKAVGYGVGENPTTNPPNLLRIVLGYGEEMYQREVLVMYETNVDDMNPQFIDYLLECLKEAGALDVNVISVQMKKNRPGMLLRILLPPEARGRVEEVLFRETTTLGIRSFEVDRVSLRREYIDVNTKYGIFKVKVAWTSDNRPRIYPEYDDCKQVARVKKVPLQVIYEEIHAAAKKMLTE